MRVRIDDCTLHCEVTGEGEPVLFVHGFPLSGEMWRPTAERLGDRFRAIIPDLRGHGQSETTAEVTIARFADDLAALLDALRERRPVVLAGLSLGGVIAFEFFRRHRDRLRALVLADTRANAETPEGVARREAMAQAAVRDGSKAVADAMIDTVFAPTAPRELREHWRGVMSHTPPLGVAAAARALAQRQESFSTLPKIDCPTLVVVGEADAITPVELMTELHRLIPGSRLRIIPGAGHVPPVEQPDQFAHALQSFLADLPV